MVARVIERDSLFSLIVGPMVWIAHFLSIYIFTALACARGFFEVEALGLPIVPLVGGAVTLVAVVLIVDAGVLSWRRWRGAQGEAQPLPPHDDNHSASRRRFMGYAGLLLSGIALIATIWEALPVLFFTTCR
jgi:hypothetical protein